MLRGQFFSLFCYTEILCSFFSGQNLRVCYQINKNKHLKPFLLQLAESQCHCFLQQSEAFKYIYSKSWKSQSEVDQTFYLLIIDTIRPSAARFCFHYLTLSDEKNDSR